MDFLKSKKLLILGCVGFFVGLLLNLPLNRLLSSVIQSSLGKTSILKLRYDTLALGTGLGLGIGRGGILGIHYKNLSLQFPGSELSLDCVEATLSPQLIFLFAGQIKFGGSCRINGNQNLGFVLSISPFYSPKKLKGEVDLKNFSLQVFDSAPALSGLKGVMNGTLTIAEMDLMNLQVGDWVSSQLGWNIVVQGFETPIVTTEMASLPGITFGDLELRGKLKESSLVMDSFKFGKPGTPIEGDLKVNFKLDSMGQPTDGDLTGRLRTDAEFEATQLADKIPMDLYFGRVRENGFREFRKKLSGNFLSFLLTPPEEL
jgi:hypothetical protein